MTEEQKEVIQEAIKKLKWDIETIRNSCPWPEIKAEAIKQHELRCSLLEIQKNAA